MGDNPQITAKAILDLLRVKHSKDVFVPECKDGPSQYSTHNRLDAWAMPRSWANPQCTGYEIKIRRSDFLSDNKWPIYLELCNSLYFVAPQGVIGKDELPAEVGLMIVARTGSRLLTKKKAPVRDVDIPESLWRYILMCRAIITNEFGTEKRKVDYWRRWLAQKEDQWEVGHAVGQRMTRLAGKRIHEIETENIKLKAQIERYAELRKILDDAGIESWSSWRANKQLQEAIQRQCRDSVAPEFEDALCNLSAAIEKTQAEWMKLRSTSTFSQSP